MTKHFGYRCTIYAFVNEDKDYFFFAKSSPPRWITFLTPSFNAVSGRLTSLCRYARVDGSLSVVKRSGKPSLCGANV